MPVGDSLHFMKVSTTCHPCLLPKKKYLYIVENKCYVSGKAAILPLMLQGLGPNEINLAGLAVQALTASQAQDLAGNAFTSNVVLAIMLGVLLHYEPVRWCHMSVDKSQQPPFCTNGSEFCFLENSQIPAAWFLSDFSHYVVSFQTVFKPCMTKVPATACIPVPTWITHQDCQVFFCLFLEIGCDLGICRRIGIWACRRIGIWACRRIGIWACRRIGIWACRRIGICCGCDFYPKGLVSKTNPILWQLRIAVGLRCRIGFWIWTQPW